MLKYNILLWLKKKHTLLNKKRMGFPQTNGHLQKPLTDIVVSGERLKTVPKIRNEKCLYLKNPTSIVFEVLARTFWQGK
jgi:hypothetical protein